MAATAVRRSKRRGIHGLGGCPGQSEVRTPMQTPAGNLIFLALMFVAFYFLLIRPQRRRLEQQRQMQSSLELGDEILTQGGLVVTVKRLDDDVITVELSPGVEARLNRRFVAGKTPADIPEEIQTDDEEREQR
jgi:preprotein translocase subunit YajC